MVRILVSAVSGEILLNTPGPGGKETDLVRIGRQEFLAYREREVPAMVETRFPDSPMPGNCLASQMWTQLKTQLRLLVGAGLLTV
jgi:hypothetical protein